MLAHPGCGVGFLEVFLSAFLLQATLAQCQGLMCAQTLHCSVMYSPCIWLHESQESILPTRMLCVVCLPTGFSFRKLYLILQCCHATLQNLESIEIQFYKISLAFKEKKPLIDLIAKLVKMPYGPWRLCL